MREYSDLEPEFLPILRRCEPATMTSVERIYALYKAVEYLSAARIAGDFVECGVWRGGSMMCAALALLQGGDTSRQLYLYDTFEGMVPPDVSDIDYRGQTAATQLLAEQRTEDSYIWGYAPLEVVRRNMVSTGYPESKVIYVRGPVEQTIPTTLPGPIALLRLDTDWYASTRHELDHLFPRLVQGGVLIIDDYGHWQGVRRAVDEYFAANDVKVLLHRIDYAGRIFVRALVPQENIKSCASETTRQRSRAEVADRALGSQSLQTEALKQELEAATVRLQAMELSTTWRILAPVRSWARSHPRVTRICRRGAKLLRSLWSSRCDENDEHPCCPRQN